MNITVPHWSATELEVMRIGLAFVVVVTCARIQILRPSGTPPYPVGLARVLDLTWLGSRRVVRAMQLTAYCSALFYVADLLVPYALVLLAGILIVDITYRCSFGAVNHGDHLLAIVLVAQSAAVLAWNAAQQWGWRSPAAFGDSQTATATWWSIQAIAAVYFTSGLSKLINTRGRWIQRSPGLLLASAARAETDSLMGARSWGASRKSAVLTAWLTRRPAIARLMFATGLLVELLTPVGLLSTVALSAVGLALIAIHRANGRLLGLPFPEYQLLVLIFFVNLPQLLP